MLISSIMATFTSPQNIPTAPMALFWIFPLIVLVSIVYKTTKFKKIKLISFINEVALLFGSIAVFVIITAVVLYSICRFVLE